ncbi:MULTISPECIES: alpha-L-rhamnosidase-related protein [unclassified Brenneria]|uniref:alpha-L-rhamnosidase-related protein n=1 Tax=unclassified Brenneria TaxID=2634434 RepID=UPI0018F0D414|nr:sugar hydrolase [Brenneria sp. L3-3C-1]MBJ7221056.1 sugar hydrolase [Brenneria sp. L3-3C-1]MEE3642297.1 sugar hydrolase [Brenneria sp. L3_3C_1]
MNRRELLIKAAVVASCIKAWPLPSAQAKASSPVRALASTPAQRYLQLAEALTPALPEVPYPALAVVEPKADNNAMLGYVMQKTIDIEALAQRRFKTGDSVIVDFGDHYTGFLTFLLDWKGISCDSPARLRLTFGEVVTDVAESLYPYNGWISAAWLPEEIINVDFLPTPVRIARRQAFRYVKIDVIATSSNFDVTFRDFQVQAVSSAGEDKQVPAKYDSPLWRDIDKVSVRTLHECMQTVFEDGPKRDRRLWLGDLRLQALANYVSFNNTDLVRRCLYLFAGLQRDDGYVTACVYEKPEPRIGEVVLLDYAALFGSVLLDYLRASQDKSTVVELWPIAKKQIELLLQHVNPQGLFVAPEKDFVFIDWNAGEDQESASQGMDKQAAMQGVLIYSCQRLVELGKEIHPTENMDDMVGKITQLTDVARKVFYDSTLQLFVSGKNRQISWASQIWMALANVLPQKDAAVCLRKVMATSEAIRPLTPYLYHHMVDALVQSGLTTEAKKLVENYWGGMIKAGADTFWEAFDPENPQASPYGSKQINSYCHAWSCTPSYFIRNQFRK